MYIFNKPLRLVKIDIFNKPLRLVKIDIVVIYDKYWNINKFKR